MSEETREAAITRHDVVLKRIGLRSVSAEMVIESGGEWVRYEDHDAALSAARQQAEAQLAEVTRAQDDMVRVAGEALDTHPDLRSPGCVDALATAYAGRGREIATLRAERDEALKQLAEVTREAEAVRESHRKSAATLATVCEQRNALRAARDEACDGESLRAQERDEARKIAADCYRATGADADGNDDAHLMTHAVHEVNRQRREFDAAETQLDEARRLLARCEWRGLGISEGHCPICGGWRYSTGHAADCPLRAYLAPTPAGEEKQYGDV